MADDFDPCECVWSHENAMQRLMSLLRSSQAYCNDVECINGTELPSADNAGTFSTTFMIMMGWLVMATALYLFRPAPLRNRSDGKPGPSGGSDGSPDQNDGPPPPPVM